VQNNEKRSYYQRESSSELFTSATTHAKVANSDSGKVAIARYRIRQPILFKNERRYRNRYWKITSPQ